MAQAIRNAGRTQAWLASKLDIDPGQVSRWVNGKAVPHASTVKRISHLLQVDLNGSAGSGSAACELFVSAPIQGLDHDLVMAHHDNVHRVVDAVRPHVNGVYWPGQEVTKIEDLAAPDLTTEANLKVLAQCRGYLYLQFAEITSPSSALIEFGFALGRRIKTTALIRRGVATPYMLTGFQGVASSLPFLPQARIYLVEDVQDAVRLVDRNRRKLLGLD